MNRITTLFLLICPVFLVAQNQYPYVHGFYADHEESSHYISSQKHTSVRPFLFFDLDSSKTSKLLLDSKSSFLKALYNKNALKVSKADFELVLNPLFHLEYGNSDDKDRYINTRGFEAKGRIGNKVRFYTSFYENQAIFPDYLENQIVDNNFIVPGQGMSKWADHSIDHDFDFAMSNGTVSYQADKFFNFQFGHGKNFIGDGYRSLMLSDNAFNYPYLKITTDFWKVRYVNIFSSYQDVRPEYSINDLNRKKFSTIHNLSVNIGKRLNINLFEAIVWEQGENGRSFDANYLNPIIFYRPIEFSLGSRGGNALLGAGFKYKIQDKSHLYGQVVLDEFKYAEIVAADGWWANKYSYQLGGKWFDVMGVDNLYLQSEVNYARPFMYSHNNPLQSFTHYNQALAHPLGASFIESVTFLRYNYKRWSANIKFLVAKYGGDIEGDNTNYGSDILTSYSEGDRNEYGNEVAQGNTSSLQIFDVRVGYLINPLTNMKLELGVFNRSTTSLYAEDTSTNYLFFAFKTDLRNLYFDF
jgi:hypothetical protein